MFRDKYGRKILCDDGCCYEDDAKYCKYCRSGECEADQEKTPINSPELQALISGEYVMYGGMLYKRH